MLLIIFIFTANNVQYTVFTQHAHGDKQETRKWRDANNTSEERLNVNIDFPLTPEHFKSSTQNSP